MKLSFNSSCVLSTALAIALTASSATAQEKVIDGYFRIQTAAGKAVGSNYVEVRGPFTAQPDNSAADAQAHAGTVFYISGVKKGSGANAYYKLTNLRSQGIDACRDEIAADDYVSVLETAVNSGGSPVYALVRQGFEHGYTSVARAAVGAAFVVVATALERYGDDASQEAYINVAKDFNRNVVANLNLDICLLPCAGGNVQLFYDVPNLSMVSEWYLGDGSEEQNARKATFESAMDAMTNYLDKNGLNFEVFLPSDLALLKNWGYDLKAEYPDNEVIGAEGGEYEGTVVSSFRQIFGDPTLLFNWLKLMGVKLTDPELAPEGTFGGINFKELAQKMQDHYLTKILAQYLPRLRPDQRVFLINGRVLNNNGDVTTSGNHWDAAGNTLGFASVHEVAIAGDNGKWVITPVDNVAERYVPAGAVAFDGKYYNTLYLDFPVSAADPAVTTIYALTEEKSAVVNETTGKQISYVELDPMAGEVIAARTPFVMVSTVADAALSIPNDYVYVDLFNSAPANSLPVDDGYVTIQRAPASRAASQPSYLSGVLLATSLTPEAMQNTHGIEFDPATNPIHRLTTTMQAGNDHIGYVNAMSGGTLRANEAFVMPGASKTDDMVLIGEPDNEIVTGIDGITVEGDDAATVIYDLRGVRVDKPESGRVYIINGKKALIL